MFRLLIILQLVIVSNVASAQNGVPLTTDRPDFTESGITVPRGTIQVEGGATVERAGGVSMISGSEMLIRWSPVKNFEMRLGPPGYAVSQSSGVVTDPSLGVKFQFGPVKVWDLALIVASSIPLGDDITGTRDPVPYGILAAGRDFGSVSFGAQIGGSLDTESEDFLLSATSVFSTGLSANVGGFLELAADQQPAGDSSLIIHAGLAMTVAHLVQLDIHAGTGLTETAPDYLVGAGLSLRR